MFSPSEDELKQHIQRMNISKDMRLAIKEIGKIKKNTKKSLFFELDAYDIAITEKQNEREDGLMGYLKDNVLPFDLMYHTFWPEKYFEITHNPNSPYAPIYYRELNNLLDFVEKKPEYLKNIIVDLGCGDGIKIYEMLKKALNEKKIQGTVEYLWLDDSQDMLNFAKDNFYNKYYYHSDDYESSEHIDPIMKKVHPWFKKARFQEIKGLEEKTPKIICFLWWTFGNLSPEIQKQLLQDIKKTMKKDDVFILSYFRILEKERFNGYEMNDLIDNFFKREKERYEQQNVYYYEKEIDIKNFKDEFPGIEITQDDFDVSMELDKEQMIIYDVRTFKKDIIYHGEIIVPKWSSFKSQWTPIDRESLLKDFNESDSTKELVEKSYRSKQELELIHTFLRYKNVNPKDCFIDISYHEHTQNLEITLDPKKPITFRRTEDGIKKQITKNPGEILHICTSKRFYDHEVRNIIQEEKLTIVDDIEGYDELAWQGTMKLLVIKNMW